MENAKMTLKTIQLLDYTYRNGSRVVVTNHGVTIWDVTIGRWVVDASCLIDGEDIRIAQTQYVRHKLALRFPALYKRSKKKV